MGLALVAPIALADPPLAHGLAGKRFFPSKRFAAFILSAAAFLLGATVNVSAHGLVGKRFLPATLAIDDPFVADELSLPTVSRFRVPAGGDKPARWETDLSGELSKRLSPDFGVSLGGALKILEPDRKKSVSGFDNLEVALKYVLFKSAAHETLFSLGLGWDVGGTGNKKKVDAEGFDTLTPGFFGGKGFGDLPDSLEWLKPLALTNSFGVAIPTRHATRSLKETPDGDFEIERELNTSVAKWGFTVQYNLQYLQSFVRDVGLPKPLDRMIPLVEFSMRTPLDDPKKSPHTTGTINPGVIWFGRYFQIGLEALVPVNDATSKNVGVIGQLHFYLDDIAPRIFTWTPIHGLLGPTQPR